MAALKRSLAQEASAKSDGRRRRSEPRRLLIGANRHCFYRRREGEGGTGSLLSSISDARRLERRRLADKRTYDDCPYALCTIAGVRCLIDGAPTSCMAARVSLRRI